MLPAVRLPEIVIHIPGEPFAQPRHRSTPLMKNGKPVLGKGGRPIMVEYDPKRAKSWKGAAQVHMLNALPPGPRRWFSGPVALSVLAVFTCPTSYHRKRNPLVRRWHTKRPDGDNVLKAVKDAAKGVLWVDDSQVAFATVIKIIGAQSEAPYVEIRVMELPEETLSVVLRDRILFHEETAALPPGAELSLFARRD